MQNNVRRSHRFWIRRAALSLGVLLFAPALSACPKGDVGAPCNHGPVVPDSKLVTFPALSCDELLCIYADEAEEPSGNCTVGAAGNAECNESDPSTSRFECVASESGSNSGTCKLRIQYALERSMCSRKCSSDGDCQSAGIGKQVVVDDTACQNGFACARIQTLGEFCCEKLCVCRDDLSTALADELEMACSTGNQDGCCNKEPVPDACGNAG